MGFSCSSRTLFLTLSLSSSLWRWNSSRLKANVENFTVKMLDLIEESLLWFGEARSSKEAYLWLSLHLAPFLSTSLITALCRSPHSFFFSTPYSSLWAIHCWLSFFKLFGFIFPQASSVTSSLLYLRSSVWGTVLSRMLFLYWSLLISTFSRRMSSIFWL